MRAKSLLENQKLNLTTALKIGLINWFQYLEAFRKLPDCECEDTTICAEHQAEYNAYLDEQIDNHIQGVEVQNETKQAIEFRRFKKSS